jgi:hypothetical protein
MALAPNIGLLSAPGKGQTTTRLMDNGPETRAVMLFWSNSGRSFALGGKRRPRQTGPYVVESPQVEGGCLNSIDILNRVAGQFSGVRFMAINVDDGAETLSSPLFPKERRRESMGGTPEITQRLGAKFGGLTPGQAWPNLEHYWTNEACVRSYSISMVPNLVLVVGGRVQRKWDGLQGNDFPEREATLTRVSRAAI